MRPHSRYSVDATRPRARGVCDACGFHYQLDRLRWQYQWVGPKLQNLRFLVCDECYDVPQEQLRTIVLPPDPVPVFNPRPENYVSDDNPLSAIGADANPFTPEYGSRIGNLTGGGGLNAPFDSNINKPAWMCANNTISNSSYNNYIGINWQGNVSNLNIPSSMQPPVLQHTLKAISIYAPNDRGFLGGSTTDYVVQASDVGDATWASWTTISSGTTTGATAEEIDITLTSTMTNPTSQFHRVAFLGDQTNFVAVAQVEFSVAEVGEA